MANVHRIGDYQNNNNQGNYQQMRGNGFLRQDEEDPPVPSGLRIGLVVMDQQQRVGNPRKESVFDMCITQCCPTFRLFLFINLVTVVQILMFIIECVLSKTQYGFGSQNFLDINSKVVYDLGANNGYAIQQKYQLWRLITPIFLHANFLHIVFNMLTQLIWGISLETTPTIGTLKIALLYILSGIGGNLFSILIQPDGIKVGASTSIMGIIAGYLGFLVLNWRTLRTYRQYRFCLACTIGFIIVFTLLFGLSGGSSGVDGYGHLGGFLTGTLASICLFKPYENMSYTKNCRLIASALLFIYFLVGLLCLFFSIQTNRIF